MSDSDRRDFLKKSAAAAAMLGVAGPANARPRGSQTETLRAIGEAVLPTADLGAPATGGAGGGGSGGARGIAGVVDGFETWIDGFQPVAEMPHGYLNRGISNIRYGPAHPGPRWSAQVEALELLAERRHRAPFAELSIGDRRALIESQLQRDELGRLPSPATARHVAVGLMAFFYASSEATDLCYRAAIGRHQCRGLSGLEREPSPLAAAPEALSGGAGGRIPRRPGRRTPITPASAGVDEGS